jgi:hypothetical protein
MRMQGDAWTVHPSISIRRHGIGNAGMTRGWPKSWYDFDPVISPAFVRGVVTVFLIVLSTLYTPH